MELSYTGKILTFDGIKSNNASLPAPILVTKPPSYSYPERNYEYVDVPGRNGQLLIDDESYKNVDRTYSIAMGSETATYQMLYDALMNWLTRPAGYCKLEDEYDGAHYVMASFSGGGSFTNTVNHILTGTIRFNCRPQRYHLSGQSPRGFSPGISTILNPYSKCARPFIRVHGSADNSNPIVITFQSQEKSTRSEFALYDVNEYVDIDCELGEVYKGNTTYNNEYIIRSFQKYIFPALEPGLTEMKFEGKNLQYVEVTPKWWEI